VFGGGRRASPAPLPARQAARTPIPPCSLCGATKGPFGVVVREVETT
jgi:hypothetical protein